MQSKVIVISLLDTSDSTEHTKLPTKDGKEPKSGVKSKKLTIFLESLDGVLRLLESTILIISMVGAEKVILYCTASEI